MTYLTTGPFRPAAVAVALAAILTSPSYADSDQPLDLHEAVSIAMDANDPTVQRFTERAAALEDRAVADSQLPDPQLRFGLANWPVDSFDFEQEPMTQIQVGLRQQFPSGSTRSLTGDRRRAEAREQIFGKRLQELQIALDVRNTWLELYYWLGARDSVEESREAVAELVEVIEAQFATGLQSNQDLLRAELELSLVDDRAVDVDRQIETLRADLFRLVGAPASRPLPDILPVLPVPPVQDTLVEGLVGHPAVKIEDARITAQNRDIDLANEQYKPAWSLDAGYGVRGGGRADFASLMVVVDLPFFTANRQDKRVAAATRNREAARFDRSAKLLEMKRVADRTRAEWHRLSDRIDLYEDVVINRAGANAEAALDGYQNRVADFAELVRSRLAEIEAALKLRRLKVDHAKAQARLLFLAGDAS
ncbi:MAG: TolC family protein [Alphaproteobacteria bacterium]